MPPDSDMDSGRKWWDAGKAKAGCGNSRPAFNPVGLMIAAECGRLDTRDESKDRRSAFGIQGCRSGNPDDFARQRLGAALRSNRGATE